MWSRNIIFVLCSIVLQISTIEAVWSCVSNEDCSSLSGGVCSDGSCHCPIGQQPTLGGTVCADVAPYYMSRCVEDFQCAGLITRYTCRKDDGASEGVCSCQPGYHYLAGRCWPSVDHYQPCSSSEECQNTLRDPFSMSCISGTCECSAGYYLRQRGECRLIGAAPGAGCVLDADCQFNNGACDTKSFTCYDTAVGPVETQTSKSNASLKMVDINNKMATRQYRVCDVNNTCAEPFLCSSLGVCVCPRGYYASDDGSLCFAELGTPTLSEDVCSGMFATIREGKCNCPPNIYYDENMRDCVKATVRLTDSCVSDVMCHTFGAAAQCGPPQEPWGVRSCQCQPEVAVWSQQSYMCRLFAGIGDTCDVDSDCLAGDVEILCSPDGEGVRRCTCPQGLEALNGLCLNLQLELGASCQATLECSGKTEYSVCEDGVCACGSGYQQGGDLCLPEIGGVCSANSDCLVTNTECVTSGETSTCQCRDGYVADDGLCWIVSSGYNTTCEKSTQCSSSALGEGSLCKDNVCDCVDDYHYKDGSCNQRTGLFEACSRSSQCYLPGLNERVTCRNGLCQCQFEYPYLEDQRTCMSGAATIFSNAILIVAALSFIIHR